MAAPSSPDLYIMTREDGRKVYHLGSLGPLPQDEDRTKPLHLGPYTDGAINTPAHWWCARVTDRTNCPIIIKRSPAQIVAANRMFPFGDTGALVPSQPPRVPYTQMGASDITVYMPTTGERPAIGLISDNSAYFMLGKDPAPMIDWALSAESCPMHLRDEATGKPINILKYPNANAYSEAGKQGSPNLVLGPLVKDSAGNFWPMSGGGWQPQQAHYTEMSYLAYVATLDMGFLEDLQFSATFTVLADAWLSSQRGIATIYGEYRGIAWAFRNLFMAHIATQDAEAAKTLPASCHPSSYWKTLLDNQLAYYSKFITDPANQVFRLVSGPGQFGPWQVDYMLTALAFGVLTGHSDWVPLYLWALKNAIDRTSGKSGYPPGYGGAYYLPDAPDWKTSWLTGVPTLAGAEPPTAAQIAILAADPLNGGVPMYGQEYLMTTRAALVMADYLDAKGLATVRTTYPDFDIALTNITRMFLHGGSVNPRVSVVLDPNAPPVILPPIQPPTEIHMPTTAACKVGQTIQLNLNGVVPPDGDLSTLAYTSEPAEFGTVTKNETGVAFAGLAAGVAKVIGTVQGVSGPVTTECDVAVSVAVPLVTSLGTLDQVA